MTTHYEALADIAKHVYKDAKHAVYLSPTDDSACESTAKKKKKETST